MKRVRGLEAGSNARDEILSGFLDSLKAKQLWSVDMPGMYSVTMRGYSSNGKIFIVQAHTGGFEIYIPASESIKTQETFDAVRKYING